MAAMNTIWNPGLLAGIAAAYIIWAMVYFIKENRRVKGCSTKEDSEPLSTKCKRPKEDIIGKSLFVLTQRHSLPQAAANEGNEKHIKNPDIFAPASVPEHPRQIPPEELDEVFGSVPEGEANEPLEIDFPLYVESFPDEQAEEPDFEDDTEDLPLVGRSLAQGVSFEQMGEAYRHVVHNPTITDAQKEETGRVLLGLKETDMFEAIVSGQPERDDKVKNLINIYLTAFHRRMSERSGESQSPQGDVPAGFDVRKYV